MKKPVSRALFLVTMLLSSNMLMAQSSMTLSSGTATAGSPVSLDLTLNSAQGSEPAGLQLTFTYPDAAVANFVVTPGAALSAAGKSLTCGGAAAAYICIATGLNANLIANGSVATVAVTLASGATSVAVGVSDGLGASLDGSQIALNTTGGAVTGASATFPVLSGLSCNPNSLTAGAVASCTVTMSAPLAAGGTVTLTSAGSISVPSTVSIAPNAATATFSATAGSFNTDQSASITASWNGNSASSNLSLTASPTSISSVQCAATTLAPATSTTCTVTLSQAASSSASVSLASSLPTTLIVPASVQVAAGASSATFTITAAGMVSTTQTASLSAILSASTRSISITVSTTSAPALSSLQCASTSLTAAASTTCTVTLSQAAPNGASVSLASSLPVTLIVPASVQIAAGASSATFTITAAGVVASNQTVSLSATLGASTQSIFITISNASTPAISSLQCASTSLVAPSSTTCTVTLSIAAPAGGLTVTLSSSLSSALTVPVSVFVQTGASSATFTASATTSSAAGSASPTSQTATITASTSDSNQSQTITILAAPAVSSLQCASTTLAASASTTCTVTLSAAPTASTNVTLSSSATSALTVPTSVTVNSGATTATFTAKAGALAVDQSATITASLGVSSSSVTISITASSSISLQCASTTLTPNMSTQCAVSISKPAAGTGVSISLSTTGDGSLLSTPSSVTIPGGATSVPFTTSAGAVKNVRQANLRAASATSSTSLAIALSPDASAIAQLVCSPVSVVPGASGTCSVSFTAPTVSSVTVTLKSSNAGVSVPSALVIPQSFAGASFPFTSSSNLTSATITATAASISKSVTITAAPNAASSSNAAPRLTCKERTISAGAATLCELRFHPSDSQEQAAFSISSTSANVKVPATIHPRTGARSIRFEVQADAGTRQDNVTIEATSPAGTAQTSLAILAPGTPRLQLPAAQLARAGSELHFVVTAVDTQNLPLQIAPGDLPSGASFNQATGEFTWTPTEANLQSVAPTFSARDAAGVSTTGTVQIRVVSGTPAITGLRNGAGENALAACTPGARMSLLGSFPGDQIRVRVNGEPAQVLLASAGQVDFLCPALAAGTPLSLTAEAGDRTSAEWRTVMAEAAPGLLSVNGSGKGQGFAMHARGLAAIPRFDLDGTPAIAGETITLYATGMGCNTDRLPVLWFGQTHQPVASVAPSAFAGVCELQAVVPDGIAGSSVELSLELIRSDATPIRSNTVSLAIDTPVSDQQAR